VTRVFTAGQREISTADGAPTPTTSPNMAATSRRWIKHESKFKPAPVADDRIRPLPDPSLDPWTHHEETLARSTDLPARGRSAYTSAPQRTHRAQIVDGAVVADVARGLLLYGWRVSRLLILVRGIETGCCDLRALLHGRDSWSQPLCGCWLSGRYPQGARQLIATRAHASRTVRPVASETSAISTRSEQSCGSQSPSKLRDALIERAHRISLSRHPTSPRRSSARDCSSSLRGTECAVAVDLTSGSCSTRSTEIVLQVTT